jgi:ubiquinone/menaquinone biosynthesis C-methylase UbiE
LTDHINELKAAEAFSRQAPVFDQLFGRDTLIRYKRERVRNHILSLDPGKRMLEINFGSGEDACYFASRGFSVHATDISEGMLRVLAEKAGNIHSGISFELCSYTSLDRLMDKGPFDAVYSNFGGLNCTRDIGKVLGHFPSLIKPGGTVTLVVISPFCFWELMLVFRGRFRTALRRLFSSKGRRAFVEGKEFRCWYHWPGAIRKEMKKDFDFIGMEGLCTLVPPSYMEGFADRHPGLFRWLSRKENSLKSRWPWKAMGDYYIISFRRK